MFQCAWCKKEEIDPWEWSQNKEPLCKDCVDKYNFGLARGMIKGKVSNLSKEQRREISARLHNLIRFRGAINSIDKEILTGRAKTLSLVSAWVLGLLAICAGIISTSWFSDEFPNMLLVISFIILAIFLQARFKWFLKYRQLKQESVGR